MRKCVLFAGLALLLVSCAGESALAPEDFLLEAAMPGNDASRTVLGIKGSGVYPVLWGSGDCISVNGVMSRPLQPLEAGAASATFRFANGIAAPYNVLYGAVSGRSDEFEIPSVQRFADGNISNGCAPMYAASYDIAFTMHHLSCIVSLPLSGTVSLAGLSLSSLDGTPIAGCFKMNKAGHVFSGTATALQGATVVNMTVPSGGVSLSSGATLCLAIRPGCFEKGLCFDIYASDGSRMNLTAFVGQTLEPGKVYELPAASFTANAEPVTPISSYQELKDFAALVSAGENYLHARLTSSITVDAAWTPLAGFNGDFDGGGYRISGLQKAFANELQGCIRNLGVEGDITVSGKDDIVGDESVYWAGILCNRIYTGGMVLNCTVDGSITYTQWGKDLIVGGLCGYAPRGTIGNCVNRATVSAVGDGSKAVYAGGLFGRIYASSEIISVSGCRNEGAVTVRGNLKGASVGGIVGHMDAVHTSTLLNNVNCASLQVDAASVVSAELRVGGIAGYSLNDIAGCSNRGAIRQGASTASLQNVGGICGSIIAGNISACSFSGSILLDGASSAVVRCGGILGLAAGDATVSETTVSDCLFSGDITLDIPSHSTLYAKAITGLYSVMSHTENDCVSSGTITVR